MQVIIPLAGFGTRLRPHTYTKPKPLVNVAGKPVLGHILDKLAGLDVEDITFITGYLGEKIEQYVNQNYSFVAHYVEQKELKGQAHAIRLAKELVHGPVLIIFVDTIFEADLLPLKTLAGDGVIFVREVLDPRRFGVVTLKDGAITRFVEKPMQPISNLAVIGVYYLKDSALLFDCIDELIARNIQTKGEYFLADALQLMVNRGARLQAWPVEVWEDCGTPDAVLQTNRYLLGKLAPAQPPSDEAIIIPPVQIDPTATIQSSIVGPFVYVGAGCLVESSIVGPYVSLAAESEIHNSIINDSIINEGSKIEEATLTHSLIGERAHVRGTFERLNVGDSSEVDSLAGPPNHRAGG
jgi:glucose-1-phosphate thymidylyltransferase